MKQKTGGFTLIEIMIAVAIIGIFFVSVTHVYFTIGKGILGTRTRTVSSNLAQEKIEYLKNISYSRLRVTSANDIVFYGYDKTYYPPEMGLLIGNIPYERRVLIKRVTENSTGDIIEVMPDAGDTGLKKVIIKIVWTEEGRERSLVLSNMRQDPNRRGLEGTISGTIKDDSTFTPLSGASVVVVDHINWNAVTDASGNYSVKVTTGTYSVMISRDGYWPKFSAPMATIVESPMAESME